MEKSNEVSNPETIVPGATQPQTNVPQQYANETPEQQFTEPSFPQNTNKKWLLPSLIALIIVAFSIAGYFAYQNFQLKKEQPNIGQTSPTPTADTPSPTTDKTASWKTLTSGQFGFTLKYPNDWVYYKNGNNDTLKLPYVRNLSSQNETLVKTNGCAIHFGFGGGSGPSNDIQSQTVSVGTLNYTKKTWSINNKPAFASYLYDGASPATKKFELLFAWISEKDPDLCQIEIDQILSTFKFSEQAEPTTLQATKANLTSTSGWSDASLGSLSIKVPAQATITKSNCTDEPYATYEECYLISGHDNNLLSPPHITIKTKAYLGGSRRQEAGLTQNPGTYTFAEKTFGNNN